MWSVRHPDKERILMLVFRKKYGSFNLILSTRDLSLLILPQAIIVIHRRTSLRLLVNLLEIRKILVHCGVVFYTSSVLSPPSWLSSTRGLSLKP